MGDAIYNVYQYLININPDTTNASNLKKVDVTPAITFSIFDTKGKLDSDDNEIGDGIITKEEFNAVSKEDYEKYCQKVKEDINKDPSDPMERTKNSVRQYAEEEGINNEEYLKKLELQLKSHGTQQEDLTSVTPISYEVLKKYIKKHGSIDYETLRNKEAIAEKTVKYCLDHDTNK